MNKFELKNKIYCYLKNAHTSTKLVGADRDSRLLIISTNFCRRHGRLFLALYQCLKVLYWPGGHKGFITSGPGCTHS